MAGGSALGFKILPILVTELSENLIGATLLHIMAIGHHT
jgi:hypothetical protein